MQTVAAKLDIKNENVVHDDSVPVSLGSMQCRGRMVARHEIPGYDWAATTALLVMLCEPPDGRGRRDFFRCESLRVGSCFVGTGP